MITMSRYDKQLANQRAKFNRALKNAKCHKDGARILEIAMPDVICSKCSTRYILAIRGGFILHWKLIEQNSEEKVIIKDKEVIVKIRCTSCYGLYDETLNICPHCGARV